MKEAIDEIEQTEILDGARIWKLYNHGFIIRTRSVTVGFDLVRGKSVRVEEFSIENNVSLVITPEGLSFSQMGDQSNNDDFEWIDEVGIHHAVDVLMPNCWTTDIVRVAKGFNPAIIITGHENEMGHTIDHREPYWLTYQRREGSDRFGGSRDVGYDTPLILMTWGESYHYKKIEHPIPQ